MSFYEFGPFRVDTRKRLLLRNGEVTPITPKAFDILLALIENRDKALSKDKLMQAVWPDVVVEENNLTRNISTLRRALGERPNEHQYVVTIPGRGYQFVAEVRRFVVEDAGAAVERAGPAEAVGEKAPPPLRAEPDGKQVAFRRDYKSQEKCALIIANVDGSNERTLATRPLSEPYNYPAWAPDGKVIICSIGTAGREGNHMKVNYRSWREPLPKSNA